MTGNLFTIIGRSSSTFTRVARIFAAELGVSYGFEVVRDLQSVDVDSYGGNPGLKVPSMRSPDGTWFGALNACRALARASERPLNIVWPEALTQPLLANLQELVLQAMTTEVGLIMSGIQEPRPDTFYRSKLSQSLRGTLGFIDRHLPAALAALPQERDLSYLEVTLFCLVAHLDFRNVMSTAPYDELCAFRQRYGTRAACRDTEYHFDA